MKHLSKAILRTAIIGTLVIILFVGVILVYYNMVYDEKKDGIIKDGRILANQSADEFDRYLSTNIDLIKITAYTLDGMITEKKSNDEIQDYLVGQSTAIRNAVVENYTGLYGYINGRFFSGTYWIPPEGYDSRIRPWYTKPMENPGKITILEPYVDVQSGNTMMALGKTLCDGVSVISVDVSLDQMQYLTEESVVNGGSDIEMIIAGDGSVVTHSDIDEVGKNYFTESGTLGSEIFKMLSESRDSYFEVDFEGENYIVYNASFQDDWYCISVHRASEVFNSLTRILIATIVIAIAIVVTIGIIIAVSGRRSVIAERALASSEAKSAFLSNMSHEIRTPINAVLGMNEMILRESRRTQEIKEGNEQAVRDSLKNIVVYAGDVENAGHNLLALVNDILDFSKIEAGRLDLVEAPYQLSSLLSDLSNMVQLKAQDKKLGFVIDVDKNLPDELNGDEVRVRQVLTNLLINAVKYTEFGSVGLTVKGEKHDDGILMLIADVKDTGIGIKKEDLEKLFTKFERLEMDRNSTVEGTGLGLTITKRLLDMMGGSISVESQYGSGSTFTVKIPQKIIKDVPMGDFQARFEANVLEARAYKEAFHAPNAHILIVDDTRINLTVVSNLLKNTRIQIDTAVGGSEAVSKAKDIEYDIILMDQRMPEMDGIEALHKIRATENGKSSKVPVICLTADAVVGAKEKYLAEGFDDYLSKPVDGFALEKMLMKYLPKEKVEPVQDAKTEDIGERAAENQNTQNDDLNALHAAGIETNIGLQYVQNDAQFYRSILGDYVDGEAEKKKLIQTCYAEEDWHNYMIQVHSLKSSSKMIGAIELSEMAAKQEQASKEGDTDTIRTGCAPMIKKYKEVADAIRSVIKAEAPAKQNEEILEFWPEK